MSDAYAISVDPAALAERTSRMRLVREYVRRPLGVIAGAFLLLVILAVALAPLISPYDPLDQDLTAALALPSPEHLLGTDRLGRDVLSRLLWGGQVSLGGLVEALAVAFVIGVVLGLLSGYSGRFADNAISRTTEVLMATPGIVVLLMVYGISQNNSHLGMVTLGVLCSPTITRVTRAAARTVREEVFISSSEVLGMSRARIVLRHILPNVWGPIIINTAVLGAVILGIQGGLNYINLGVNPPAPSWGGMVSDAQRVLAQQPWLIVPSGLLLTLVIMALMLVADGLRDAAASNRSRPQAQQRAAAQAPAVALPEPELHPRSALAVRGLSVSFGGLQVVRDVSFEVLDGQTLGIVGESGCGKSVTASAILDQLGPGSRIDGQVVFGGVDLNHAPAAERARTRGTGIAYVSQDPMVALDPSFTVASQLGELVGRHDRVRGARRRARVLELLAQVGIPDPADTAARFPHQLSGGMAQRVAVACALAGRPRVLVADEPTTALDVTIQGEILELLRRLRDDTGMAIILITHDLGVVADLCDRVAVMYAGQVVELADVGTLFAAPAHPYTRGLLASNPIASERCPPLPSIPGTVPSPSRWPVGCHFRDRCPFAVEACAQAPIPLFEIEGKDQSARCIRIDELVGAAATESRSR
ncbi:dipeptide/oligopeptide/nickel ABC transporter permease/ATP-binding protein [soil metagenome]